MSVNVKQMKWILSQCSKLTVKYEQCNMSDSDWENLIEEANAILSLSKNNSYCKQCLIYVLSAFDLEERRNHELGRQRIEKA